MLLGQQGVDSLRMEEEDNALWKHYRLDHGGEKVEFSMNSPKPKQRLVFEDQIFQNRNRDFFSEPNSLNPKPCQNWQKS